MKRLFGNIGGLKASQIRRLENLYRRRLPPKFLITPELARDICNLSHEIRRQIGLLINRQGKIAYVILGNHQGIVIPDAGEYRASPGRLKGLRCVHTHLNNEPLTRDDLTDLALLRLDVMAAMTITESGYLHRVHVSHILPTSSDGEPFQILKPLSLDQLDIGCLDLIQSIESELAHVKSVYEADMKKERHFLSALHRLPSVLPWIP